MSAAQPTVSAAPRPRPVRQSHRARYLGRSAAAHGDLAGNRNDGAGTSRLDSHGRHVPHRYGDTPVADHAAFTAARDRHEYDDHDHAAATTGVTMTEGVKKSNCRTSQATPHPYPLPAGEGGVEGRGRGCVTPGQRSSIARISKT